MKQQDNNIDIFFKTGVENSSLNLNKDQAWESLIKMRLRKRIINTTVVSLFILFLVGILTITLPKRAETIEISDEFSKRQKLEEYERKLSGTYEELFLCFDCHGTVFQSQIKQVPENNGYLKIY